MASSWALAVAREDLSRTELFEGAIPQISEGKALLRVGRVGVTANNVTYAVLGESFHYWDFSRGPRLGAWMGTGAGVGFAEVAASAAGNVEVGGRVYGYLPSASHVVVGPDRAG